MEKESISEQIKTKLKRISIILAALNEPAHNDEYNT